MTDILQIAAGRAVQVKLFRGRDEVSEIQLLWRDRAHPEWQLAGTYQPNGDRREERPDVEGFHKKTEAWEATIRAHIIMGADRFEAPKIETTRNDPNITYWVFGGQNDRFADTVVTFTVV
jgi:hypothetical protein